MINKNGEPPFLAARRLTLVRVVGVEPTRITSQEPKSCASANSAIPAYINVRKTCRYFVVLCFYTVRNRGGAYCLIRAYKNRMSLLLPNTECGE